MTPTLGSLFSGYGGLDRAISEVFGAETVWVSDVEEGPNKVLAQRFPDAYNIGDITKVDWREIEPVDIISGGSPCQDLSSAGHRAGMTEGTRSNLWVQMREAIATLRPKLVVWENVMGALSASATSELESVEGRVGDGAGGPALRALGRVLGDLAEIGFDAEWATVRASDAGAPHSRARVFLLAWQADSPPRSLFRGGGGGCWSAGEDSRLKLLPTPKAGDADFGLPRTSGRPPERSTHLATRLHYTNFKVYAPAVERWERVIGREAPAPTKPSPKGGKPQLSPEFVEWMMGLPAGWVTDPGLGLSRVQQLRLLGNGVVPQQAASAISSLLERMEEEAS